MPAAPAPVDVALAVLRRGDAVLLQRRARAPFAGQWELPGGKVRGGEAPRDAAVREVREELGFDARVERDLGVREHRYNDGPWVRLHVFEVSAGAATATVQDGPDLRWVPLDATHALDVLEGTKPVLAALHAERLQQPRPRDRRKAF